jgi:septal ring factor EnvC (AmiA/AmiB activator)
VNGFLKYNKFRITPLLHYSILFCLLFSVVCLLSSDVFAQTQRDEYRKLQQELRIQKQKLDSVRRVERSAIEELRKTTAELKDIEDQLSKQRGNINRTQGNISKLQKDINNIQADLNLQYSLLKKRLRVLQRVSREEDAFLIILSGKDMSQILRLIRYIEDIAAYDHAIIDKYKETVTVLSKKQEELRSLFLKLKSKEAKLAKLEKDLKERKREREVLLVSARKERRSYERAIREMEEASKRLKRIIQEAERRERELRARELQERRRLRKDPPARQERTHPEGEFVRLRGRLPWPVHGSIATQFGSQIDPLFNLPVFRSGIHIRADRGAPVRAVHEGKVVFADKFQGYGQLVIISHGDGYHTLYGNLSRIFFQNGAIIKENAIIGEAGESSALGINGVYFEIRHKGKPLDPQQWLRR